MSDEEGNFTYRGKNDPYNDAERPEFLSKNSNNEESDSTENAKNELSNNEKSALDNGPANDAKSAENPGSSFINNVTGNKSDKLTNRLPGKNKFNLKGKGPIGIVIALLLLMGGGLLLGGQSLMPFAITNRIIEEMNSMGYSNSLRSRFVIKYLADNNKLSKKAIKQLEAQGIEVQTKGKKQVFSFEDSKGVKHTDLDFDTAVKEYPEFKMKYDAGSKMYAGQYGGWFDGIAGRVFTRLGITRSRWDDWDGTKTGEVDPETGKNEVEEKFKERADTESKSVDVDGKRNGVEETTKDKEGNIHKNKILEENVDPNKISKTESITGLSQKLDNISSKAGSLANGGQIACGAIMALTALHSIVSAIQSSDMLNLASGYLESTQKIQAGDGNYSPMQLYNNELTKADENGKTAMSSTGMSMLFNGSDQDYSNSNDESLQEANTELAVSHPTVAKIMLQGAKCLGWGGVAMGAISLVTTFMTGGTSKLITTFITSAAAGLAMSAVLGELLPILAKTITKDVITNMVGEDAGNYLVAGSSKYTGKNHQASGGAPGDEAKVTAFKQASERILAEQAEQERQTLSPFDISSRYTFMGSIFYSLAPYLLASSDNTISKTLSSTKSIVSSSIASILPTSSALGVTKMITATNNCPFLQAVGAKGDAYCNPYYVDDTSTLELSVEDVVAKLYPQDIDSTDLEKANIKEDSELAKFKKYCGERDSSYGVLDANISSELSPIQSDDPIWGTALEASDVKQIIDGFSQIGGDQYYITGEYCIAKSNSPETHNYWENKGKYYQRFLSDQRIMANASDDSTVVSRYDEKYYAEHPIDTSYEAVIARLSGQTKEQVIAQLEELEYQEFVANYDASNLYSFGSTPTNPERKPVKLDFPEDIDHNVVISTTTTFNHFVYADLRYQTTSA